ncbi:2Fe-2S iron-sulfur cluster-binding protein [Marinobacter sp. JSM 1782161]|uniref:2Fe-2S iron-sulfur cluster-binding protein n=1 Tax=Marinobacter sp. JSM 1782161 TaxID=2685906 RepID=UPI001D197B3E|nr:2Fe-2S iron-sulfur cluster-binding protein [Marinobacter sp. JSM 1782161]
MPSGPSWALMSPHRDDPVRVRIDPAGLEFTASPRDDLLTAARRAGIAIRWSCRNGVCELCEARLKAGRVLNTRTDQEIEPPATLMLCRSQPRGPVELEIEEVMAAGSQTPQQMQATVSDIKTLSHDVYRVTLTLPRRRELAFHAGQYLSVRLPDASPSYFSIASSPSCGDIELHVQAATDWASAQRVMDTFHTDGQVTLELPHGKACLASAPEKPLVLVAAGTGFAQMKSIVDYLRETDLQQPVHLYWGVRRHEDMYLRSLAYQWAEDWAPFSFFPVVGDDADNDWSGHHDQLVRAVLAGGYDWSGVSVLASGSPPMVYTLMDALVEAGLPESAFLSDVLEYAPRG